MIKRNAEEKTDKGTVKGTVIENNGTIGNNQGSVQTNSGTVEENQDSIQTNAKDGTVEDNFGSIQTNEGTVNVNHNGSTIIENLGTIQYNNFILELNDGTVEVNNGTIVQSNGTVVTNDYHVVTNDGTVETNDKTVETNNGTVQSNGRTVEVNNGTVKENNHTVLINGIEGVVTNGENGSVKNNLGTEVSPSGEIIYGITFANDLTPKDLTAYSGEHTIYEVLDLLDEPEMIVITSKEADTFFIIDSKALFEKKGYSQEGWLDNLTGKYYGFKESVYMDKPYWFVPYWEEIKPRSARKSKSTQRTLSVNASKAVRSIVIEVITPGVDAAENLIDGCIGVLLGNTYANMCEAFALSVKLDGKALTDEQYAVVDHNDGSFTVLFSSDLIRSLSLGTHLGAIRIDNTEIAFALTVAA